MTRALDSPLTVQRDVPEATGQKPDEARRRELAQVVWIGAVVPVTVARSGSRGRDDIGAPVREDAGDLADVGQRIGEVLDALEAGDGAGHPVPEGEGGRVPAQEAGPVDRVP